VSDPTRSSRPGHLYIEARRGRCGTGWKQASTAGTWTWVHRMPISIPESLVIDLPSILSPSSRTFVELTLVNWRQPWRSRRLDFVIQAGSFNFFRRQDQQILRLPTAASTGSHLAGSSRSARCLHQLVIDKVCYVCSIAEDKTSVAKIQAHPC
jgi:hypothetical protein